MAKKQRYQVISPDGFSIHPVDTYPTYKEAIDAFEQWKKHYEIQGYYSSNYYGRIPLDELSDYCKIERV